MKLEGASRPFRVSGLAPLASTANYFIGSDSRQWHTAIPTYAKVHYQNVYPGVDLVYYGNRGQLEFDFVIAPGAHPEAIRLSLEGGKELKLTDQGDLVLGESGREIRFNKPHLYQEISGRKVEVSGCFVLLPARRVGFEVGRYDRTKRLMIDPVLSYSTYLGNTSFDQGYGIDVDASGNAYVTGYTNSWYFPTTSGALKSTRSGNSDAFVAKLNAGGTALVYSTFLGGSGADQGTAIAVDSSGSAYVTGQTYSSNYPTTAGALKSSYGGAGDAFVSKLSASGSSLVYSTYLGGSNTDEARGIAVDSGNNAYITGMTYSTDFPTMSPLQVNKNGPQDAFVTELNSSGSLVYSTYLGGGSYDQGNGIAVDASGDAYVTGYTKSTDFPTANALQTACKSCSNLNDAFVAEVSINGTGLVYATYLGGSADDVGMGIAVDPQGNTYVTGFTFSSDFPTTPGAFQQSLLGTVSAFVTQISTNGTSFLYSTYLGSDRYTYGSSIALLNGNAYVAGVTNSSSFPLVGAVQSAEAGIIDGFISQLNATGSALGFSTYLGGTRFDEANAIAVDSSGNMYSTGSTLSTDFPTANALQPAYGGGNLDAFITKIGVPLSVTLSPSSLTFSGEQVGTSSSSQGVTLSNPGGTAVSISSISITGTNSGDFSQTNNCGSGLASGGSCTINVTFTPSAAGTRSGTLSISDSASGSPHTAGLTGTGLAASVTLLPSTLTFSGQQVGTSSSSQGVTLSNPGGTAVSISSISITGTNSGDFSQTNNCGSGLASGGSCTINVTFTPSAAGTRSGTLSISDSASGSPQTASLTGTGLAPTASLSPSTLTFSGQQIGTPSSAQAVTLSNSGSVALSVTSITFTGPNSSDFSQTSNCPSSLAAGTSCMISITFTPADAGTRSATLSVSDNAPGSPQTASLTGTGLLPPLTLSPSGLTFSGQTVGTSSLAQTLTLSNPGSLAASISSISIGGANSGDFSQSNNCGASLAGGGSCTINVTFRPSAGGTRSATLSVSDNAVGSPQTASLAGTGLVPSATLSPTSLNFGKVAVRSTSAPQTVTLKSTGTAALTISGIAITGSNSEDYAQTNNCGSSLAVGASCTISVTFKPTAKGNRSAALSVTDNASGSPQQVSLKGSGR